MPRWGSGPGGCTEGASPEPSGEQHPQSPSSLPPSCLPSVTTSVSPAVSSPECPPPCPGRVTPGVTLGIHCIMSRLPLSQVPDFSTPTRAFEGQPGSQRSCLWSAALASERGAGRLGMEPPNPPPAGLSSALRSGPWGQRSPLWPRPGRSSRTDSCGVGAPVFLKLPKSGRSHLGSLSVPTSGVLWSGAAGLGTPSFPKPLVPACPLLGAAAQLHIGVMATASGSRSTPHPEVKGGVVCASGRAGAARRLPQRDGCAGGLGTRTPPAHGRCRRTARGPRDHRRGMGLLELGAQTPGGAGLAPRGQASLMEGDEAGSGRGSSPH